MTQQQRAAVDALRDAPYDPNSVRLGAEAGAADVAVHRTYADAAAVGNVDHAPSLP